MGEAVITYETLFEILRRERNREEIQKIDEKFIEDITLYFEQKQIPLIKTEQNIFSLSEREKTDRQVSNAKRLLKEIYDRREKKIMMMALNKAKTNSSLLNTANLLPFEKELYQALLSTLLNARTLTLLPVLKGTSREPIFPSLPSVINEEQQVSKEDKSNEDENENTSVTEEEPKVLKADLIDSQQETPLPLEEENNERKKVRFLESVPKFIGPNLEMYGPFHEQDEAELPSEIASILITKKRAEDLTKV